MFADAVAKARQFTRPVIISALMPDDTVQSSMGAFVVVNADGWVLTANHILAEYDNLNTAKARFLEHRKAEQDIATDKGLLQDQKRKRLRKLGPPPEGSIADFGFWWGHDEWTFKEAHAVAAADLALVKLDGVKPSHLTEFPQFKDPTKGIAPGTSLCRLGFPFAEVTVSYVGGTFTVDASGCVLFPNEGMLTRTIIYLTNPIVGMIETSSPGLRGQSGGPIFDRNGTVWGIQSQTGHLALGFSPPVPNGKPGQVEHQFLNVGRGTHPETIVTLLQKIPVDFKLAAY